MQCENVPAAIASASSCVAGQSVGSGSRTLAPAAEDAVLAERLDGYGAVRVAMLERNPGPQARRARAVVGVRLALRRLRAKAELYGPARLGGRRLVHLRALAARFGGERPVRAAAAAWAAQTLGVVVLGA